MRIERKDPRLQGAKERLEAELTLKAFFQRPYSVLVKEAKRTGQCSEEDLIAMGWALFDSTVRLARGEISEIVFEKRLPYPGEFQQASA